MKCPFCHHADTQVIDSRITEEGDAIRRRRKCSACERRFTTYERAELSLPVVAKRNGTRMEFDPARLRASMGVALRKRSIPMAQVDAAVQRIEEKLQLTGEREVSSETIGELVMAELKQLDQVAYVRFASVYKSFKDIREFVQAIDEMNDPDHG
ncbi:transcriptional repressor NrdR [Alcaligenes pakistanensis]|uniref:Transcriptional repressor NrdR n=1 Tax=Alcaligenes pakistanensis TaxID=1482717 RepID=A0A8H9IHR0_9BURK|nr:transcriptional regulator NrdR [Alcaligenes pakistanensis]GHC48343.1 transcriptional repressor NrdR [Alcaligenes pakistanensis]HCA17565.1 transcriptional regulator NrdR [Alcaligenes faecalis]